ncbi:MAG: lysophospholipid acyltransferase family protein [Rhodospirillaceae bacterium]
MIILRSLLFNIAFWVWITAMCVLLAWVPLLPRPQMMAVLHWFMRTVGFLERTLLGLHYEVRGRDNLPKGAYLVAAKHQSAWETMKLHLLFPDPAVVLKSELTRVPVWGMLARKSQMIPVDRGARNRAVASLLDGATKVAAQGRPIVIFPQGTRTAPGSYHSYRIGVGLLYDHLKLPIVPMALNSGVFWPRQAFLKRPGTIVVEFLPPIRPGLERFEAMIQLETRLEAATDRLVMAEGGPATQRPKATPNISTET